MIKPEDKDTTALVLSAAPYGENSAVISLAGNEGLFSVMARGVYKPNSPLKPLLITGNILSLSYRSHSTGLKSASSVEVRFDASSLLKDYVSSCLLLYLEEQSLALYRYGDPYPYLEIEALIKTLSIGGDPLSLSLLMEATFYRSLGLKMNTEGCTRCGKKSPIVSYDLDEGGFLCSDCLLEVPQAEKKEKDDLYVLKFAFSPLSASLLSKKVPKASGLRVLQDLNRQLESYFDLRPNRSFPLFLSALCQ